MGRSNGLYHNPGETMRGGWPVAAFLLFVLMCTADLRPLRGQTPSRDPSVSFEQRVAALQKLEDLGPLPLYVLGDVDEDGRVDETDLALIQTLSQTPGKPAMTTAIPCPAAADLSLDGEINQRDVGIMKDWLKEGGVVTTPALASQSYLPCKFSDMFIAAKLDAMPGGVMPLRFLDPALTTSNCSVTVEEGPGVVKPTNDGRGFDVRVSADAKAEDTVTLLIALPKGRRYYYSFPVRPLPTTGGKGPS